MYTHRSVNCNSHNQWLAIQKAGRYRLCTGSEPASVPRARSPHLTILATVAAWKGSLLSIPFPVRGERLPAWESSRYNWDWKDLHLEDLRHLTDHFVDFAWHRPSRLFQGRELESSTPCFPSKAAYNTAPAAAALQGAKWPDLQRRECSRAALFAPQNSHCLRVVRYISFNKKYDAYHPMVAGDHSRRRCLPPLPDEAGHLPGLHRDSRYARQVNGNLAERKWSNWILRVRFHYTVAKFSTIGRVENLSSAALFKPKAPPNAHVPQVPQSRYTEVTKEEKYEYILTVTVRYYSLRHLHWHGIL